MDLWHQSRKIYYLLAGLCVSCMVAACLNRLKGNQPARGLNKKRTFPSLRTWWRIDYSKSSEREIEEYVLTIGVRQLVEQFVDRFLPLCLFHQSHSLSMGGSQLSGLASSSGLSIFPLTMLCRNPFTASRPSSSSVNSVSSRCIALPFQYTL